MRLQQLLTAVCLVTGACSITDVEPQSTEINAAASFRCATEEGAALIGLDEVILCGDDVTLRGDNGVDVFSNKYIHVSGQAFVQGDLVMPEGGVFDVDRQSLVSDSALRNFGEVIEASPRVDEAAQVSLVNDNLNLDQSLIVLGKLRLRGVDATIPGGDYYFSGLNISGTSSLTLGGDVRIFVDGAVRMNGETQANLGGDYKLEVISVSNDAVSLSGASSVRLYVSAPLADISISGDTTFRGTVLGRTITVSGYVTVESLGDASNYDAVSCEPEPEKEPCGDDLPPADGGPHQPDDAGNTPTDAP